MSTSNGSSEAATGNGAQATHDYAAPPTRAVPVAARAATRSAAVNSSLPPTHRVYVMKGPLPGGGLQGRLVLGNASSLSSSMIKTVRLEPAARPSAQAHTITIQNVTQPVRFRPSPAPIPIPIPTPNFEAKKMAELSVCDICSLCFPDTAGLAEHRASSHPGVDGISALPPQLLTTTKKEEEEDLMEEEIDVVDGDPPPVVVSDNRIKVVTIRREPSGRKRRAGSEEADASAQAAADVLLSLSKSSGGKKHTPFSPQGKSRIKQVIHLDAPKFEVIRPWLKRDLPDTRVTIQAKRRSGSQKLFPPPSTQVGTTSKPTPTSESGPGMPVFCCSACKSGCRSKGQMKDTGGLPLEDLAHSDPDIQEEYRYKCDADEHSLVFKHLLSWRAHTGEDHADLLDEDWQEKKCVLCEEIQYDESMMEWHLAAVHEIHTAAAEKAKPTEFRAPSGSRRSGNARRGVRPLHRKNAATTKLPGSGAGAEAPPLEEMNPSFLEQIQTVDQRRHFRQAHAERLMQQLLLNVSEKLDGAAPAVDGSEILVLLETFQDYWRIFHPASFDELMDKLGRVDLDDSGMELPPLSTRIADSYTKTRGVYETIHEAVELGQWILEAKKRKPRINFACRKFPGSDQDAPPLHQLSASNIAQLGYDQIRRFRRAQSEVFLYELLRFIPNLTQIQQKVLLSSLWRYWWVFYPDELHLKEEAEAAVIASQSATAARDAHDGLDVVG